jgi:hypothetical protein
MSNAHVDATLYNTQKKGHGTTVISFKARLAAKPKQKIFFSTPSISRHSAAPTHSIVLGKVLLFEAEIDSWNCQQTGLVSLCLVTTDWETWVSRIPVFVLSVRVIDWAITLSGHSSSRTESLSHPLT